MARPKKSHAPHLAVMLTIDRLGNMVPGPRLAVDPLWITIDGARYDAITIFEAAKAWHDAAKKEGWPLCDLARRPLSMKKYKVEL